MYISISKIPTSRIAANVSGQTLPSEWRFLYSAIKPHRFSDSTSGNNVLPVPDISELYILAFVFHYSLTSQPNALAPNTAASASFNSEINNLVLPS